MKTILLALFVIFLSGCSEPDSWVMDTSPMVVYHAEVRTERNAMTKFKYIVSDDGGGWVLYSNKEMQLGDVVELTIKKKGSQSAVE